MISKKKSLKKKKERHNTHIMALKMVKYTFKVKIKNYFFFFF